MKTGDTVFVSFLQSPGPVTMLHRAARVLAVDGELADLIVEGSPAVKLERVPKGPRPLQEGPSWLAKAPEPEEKASAPPKRASSSKG